MRRRYSEMVATMSVISTLLTHPKEKDTWSYLSAPLKVA
jgi:hypothetical protein